MTKDQAITLAKTGWWKKCSSEEITAFQLYEPLLCMNFGDFHRAVERALDRPVWTHEFVDLKSLQSEFEENSPKATFKGVVEKLDRMLEKKKNKE